MASKRQVQEAWEFLPCRRLGGVLVDDRKGAAIIRLDER